MLWIMLTLLYTWQWGNTLWQYWQYCYFMMIIFLYCFIIVKIAKVKKWKWCREKKHVGVTSGSNDIYAYILFIYMLHNWFIFYFTAIRSESNPVLFHNMTHFLHYSEAVTAFPHCVKYISVWCIMSYDCHGYR